MRARDEQEFVEFATATADRLFRGAYALCGDRQTAEDAVQAALTSACVSWQRSGEQTARRPTCAAW